MPDRSPIDGKRLVAFDMDGVLVDSFDCWWKLLNGTLANHGKRQLPRDEFAACWGQDVEADRKRFFPDWTTEQLIDHYTREFPRYAKWHRAEPGAAETLRALKESGVRLAVASNSPTAMVERLLEQNALRGYFDLAAGVDLVLNGKPEPDLIEYVLEGSNTRPEDACFVGDSDYDARAARAAGVLFIGYKRPGDRRIDSLAELLAA